MGRDYKTLVEKARSEGEAPFRQRPPLQPSPSVVGKALIAAWAETHGRSRFPSIERLTRAVLALPVPAELRSFLCIEDRITGPLLADWSDWISHASIGGLVARVPGVPGGVDVEIDRTTAQHILAGYPSILTDWARGMVVALDTQPMGAT